MSAFLAVVRRELWEALVSPVGWRITVIHLALALLSVFLGWPVSYVLGSARWAPAFAWWVYAEILVLSYLTLAVSADVFEVDGQIRPGDWITYGQASIWAVYLGQTAATALVVMFWLLTAAPAPIMGLVLSPVSPDRLRALALFGALLLGALIQVGTWIGVTIDSRSYRIVAVDVAFSALMIGSLLVQLFSSGSSRAPMVAQPLEVAATILDVSAREALLGSAAGTLAGLSLPPTHSSSQLIGFPWVSLVVMYGSVLLVAGALALFSLRQWKHYRSS